MRVKRESRRLSAVVKKEDEDTLAAGLTPMIVEPTLPDTKPVNDLGGLNDQKPAVNQRGRVRLFVDAVVIDKRNPEVRFDRRYKRMSSLVRHVEPSPRFPRAVKKKSPSPAAPAVRTRRGEKIPKQQPTEIQLPHVKLEAQEDARLGPVPPSPIPFAEELIQLPAATPQLQGHATPGTAENCGVKVREESPDMTLGSRIPSPVTSTFQQADEEAMKKWKNVRLIDFYPYYAWVVGDNLSGQPKAKVKKEAVTLTGDSIKARLTEAGISMDLFAIDCDKEILDTTVSREFMSNKWGGSSQETFPRIGKAKLAEHGLKDFMYLPDNYQPVAPQVPGAPGIWIDENGHGGEWMGGIMRVFTRIQTGPALWVYQGQYEMKRARAMTKEEWATQTPSVRNTWARELFRKGWGVAMRANIYAINEWGRVPTKSEREDIYVRKLYDSIGVQEIALALTRGDATMALYTMRCIGYDIPFAKQVMEKWATFVPSERKPRGSGKRKASEDANGKSSQKRPTKRQKLEEDVIDVDDLPSDDEEVPSEEEYDDEESKFEIEPELEELVYKPRGTRTRPRI